MTQWSNTVTKGTTSPLDERKGAFDAQSLDAHRIQSSRSRKPAKTATTLFVASGLLVVTLIALSALTPVIGIQSVSASLLVWVVMMLVIWHFSEYHRPSNQYSNFGSANAVTTARAVSTAVIAGFIPIATQIPSTAWMWTIALTATVTLCLDGLDGYLARKNQSCSVFGARFDMETDAFLALVITVFLWQSDRTGIWVLGLGLMRYVFVVASYPYAWLQADLYPSMRRKTVCVVQVGALCLMLCPWLSSVQATVVGLMALTCLSYSFAIDILWLFRRKTTMPDSQQQ